MDGHNEWNYKKIIIIIKMKYSTLFDRSQVLSDGNKLFPTNLFFAIAQPKPKTNLGMVMLYRAPSI